MLAERGVSNPTLSQVFAIYFRERGPLLRPERRQTTETRRDLFETVWGGRQLVEDIGQTHVDRYAAARRAGGIVLEDSLTGETRAFGAVRDGTINTDFNSLSSVFNWARKHKTNGRRLLSANPLHDVQWPKEKNVRRPVASHQRFISTLARADDIDPGGRLACMLSLARYTGRREGAICLLRVSDVLKTEKDILAALAALGMDDHMAEHMPHGAIRWRAEHDKKGYTAVAPLSTRGRDAVDHYLRSNPRVGEAWLFASPRDDAKPIDSKLASGWLVKAETLAELPKLAGGRWHPYRRLWATERKTLPDADVAAAGGWRDTRALKMSYQQADPITVLRVVEAGE